MQAIQEANLTNMPGDCLTELLAEWLKSSPNPTWSQLVEALRSPIINCPDIADEIEDKYIKSDDSSVQESKDTASSGWLVIFTIKCHKMYIIYIHVNYI